LVRTTFSHHIDNNIEDNKKCWSSKVVLRDKVEPRNTQHRLACVPPEHRLACVPPEHRLACVPPELRLSEPQS